MTEKTMTRKVEQQALKLLKLAVADIADDPQAIADSLMQALTLERTHDQTVMRGPWQQSPQAQTDLSARETAQSLRRRALTLH
jgi:hypothetical protein